MNEELAKEQALHIFNWASSDAALYRRMNILQTLGNFVGSVDRFSSAAKLAIDTFAKMRKAGDMPGGISGYDETAIAYAVTLFLDYRLER